MSKVTLEDRDKPLKTFAKGNDSLEDPESTVVAIILYIHGFESDVYKTLNITCRYKDVEKVATLGPYGAALFEIISMT